MPDLKDLVAATPLLAFFLIVAYLVWRTLPTWKEVKLAEIAIRKEEAVARVAEIKVREKEAAAVGRLTEMVNRSGELTEELRIFLRVAMRQHEVTEDRLSHLEFVLDQLEAKIKQDGRQQ